MAHWRTDIIAPQRYTPQERDAVLLDFLAQLDLLKRQGAIKGNVRFILHQRQWLRPGPGRQRAALRAARVDDFATDMGDFINAARAEGLDGWIAGVRLGENADPDMTEYLPAVLEMARDINARTDGWLHGRLFLANGGNMGASFAGIADPTAHAGDFFAGMGKEAGAFAFGYKWMDLEGHEGSITTLMDEAPCDAVRACDPRSVADWTADPSATTWASTSSPR